MCIRDSAYVDLIGHPLVATVPPGIGAIGDNASVKFDPAQTHVYVADKRVQGVAA